LCGRPNEDVQNPKEPLRGVLTRREAGVAANDYWEPSFFHAKGPPTRSSARTGLVVSDEAAAALWAKSEEVTGVVYPV